MEPLHFSLFFLCVLVFFLGVCPAAHQELNRDEILCIQHSQEETALGRWLECLKSSESGSPAADFPDHLEMSSVVSHVLRDANDMISIAESPISGDSDGWIPQAPTEEHRTEQQSSIIEHFNENKMNFITEAQKDDNNNSIHIGNTDCNLIHVEDSLQPLELSPHSNQHIDQDMYTDATPHPSAKRSSALTAWLQNLGLLILIKFLHMVSRGWRTRNCSDKQCYEAGNICIQKTNIEATRNPMETERCDDYMSKRSMKNDYFLALGSPLGAAVAAVFAEVLLTSCDCGSSVSADKINMLFRTAFSDMLAPVIGDSECLKVLDDFMGSFRSIYTTMCRVHNASLERLESSQKKSRDIRPMHTPRKCHLCINPTEKCCCDAEPQDTSHKKLIMDAQSSAHLETSSLNGTNFHADVCENTPSSKMSQGTIIADGSQYASLNRQTDAISVLAEKLEKLTMVNEGDSSSSSKIDDFAKVSCCLVEDIVADKSEQFKLHCSNNDFAEDVIPDSRDDVFKVGCDVEYHTSSLSDNVCSKVGGPLGIIALAGNCYRQESRDFQNSVLSVLERYVIAQEHHNHIKSVEVAHLIRQHVLEEEKVQLTSISNDLMRENIELSKSRASFKETRVLEEKAISAYASFNSTCADELAAGLVIMLVSFAFGVRKYSFALLNDLVSLCQPPVVKESRRSFGFGVDWLLNSVDLLTGKLQAFVCHVTVTGRIFIGSLFVAVIATSLLRRSVTNSSQAMPATILVIVLGGVCGFVGKMSVDSVGGNGIRWLVIWEIFCILHALVTCFTPFFYSLLHGLPSNTRNRRIMPFWFRKLAFHFVILVLLPVLAGQLPFGSFREVTCELISSSILAFSSLREFMLY